MKIMIASDIHGSLKYCRELIEKYREEKCEKLVLLGDVLYHGPRNDLPEEYNPKGVIAILNDMAEEILCVRGNCEAEVDEMVLSFPVLAEYAFFYHKGRMFFLTHGHKMNPQNLPKIKKGDILFNGHTHVSKIEELEGGYIYANPGSVSIPKENTPRGYMVVDDSAIIHKTLSGEKVQEFVL